jgi:hypothetical protein
LKYDFFLHKILNLTKNVSIFEPSLQNIQLACVFGSKLSVVLWIKIFWRLTNVYGEATGAQPTISRCMECYVLQAAPLINFNKFKAPCVAATEQWCSMYFKSVLRLLIASHNAVLKPQVNE